MLRKVVISGFVAALLIASCGSGGGNGASSTKGKRYVDAMVASKNNNELMKQLKDSQVHCVAAKLVDAVGVDTLEKAGVTPANITGENGLEKLHGKIDKDQANQIVDAIISGSCFDFGAVMKKQDPAFAKVSADKIDCLFKNLFNLPAAKNALADALITGKDPNLDKTFGNESDLFTILGKCKISANEIGG